MACYKVIYIAVRISELNHAKYKKEQKYYIFQGLHKNQTYISWNGEAGSALSALACTALHFLVQCQ